MSLASLLPPAAEGGCTRDGIRQALLCLRQNRTCLITCARRRVMRRSTLLVPLTRDGTLAVGRFAPGPTVAKLP